MFLSKWISLLPADSLALQLVLIADYMIEKASGNQPGSPVLRQAHIFTTTWLQNKSCHGHLSDPASAISFRWRAPSWSVGSNSLRRMGTHAWSDGKGFAWYYGLRIQIWDPPRFVLSNPDWCPFGETINSDCKFWLIQTQNQDDKTCVC